MAYYVYADDELLYSSLSAEKEYQILNPVVADETDKVSSFEFVMLPSNRMYYNIRLFKTLVRVYDNNDEMFVGRVISWETDIYGQRTVKCEDRTSYLMDSVFSPGTYDETVTEFFERVIESHNSQVEAYKQFQVGNITIDEASEKKKFSDDSFSDTRSVIENAFLNEYGGHILCREENGVLYLDYIKEYTGVVEQPIEYAVNLEEATDNVSGNEIFSVLIPLGKNHGTIANKNDGSIYLEDQAQIERYGRIVVAKEWSDITDITKLKEKGLDYMAKKCTGDIPVELEIKALDNHILNHSLPAMKLGDLVTVNISPIGLTRIKRVLKLSRDLQNPENNSYTIGDPENEDKDSTSSYRTQKYTLTSLMNEADTNGMVKRDGLGFKIKGRMTIQANELQLIAGNIGVDGYTTDKRYSVGDLITGDDGKIYRLKKALDYGDEDHPKVPEFNSEDWEVTDIIQGLMELRADVLDVQSNTIDISTNQLVLWGDVQRNSAAVVSMQDYLGCVYNPNKEVKRGTMFMVNGTMYTALEDIPAQTSETPKTIEELVSESNSKFQPEDYTNAMLCINGTINATRAEFRQLIAQEISAVKGDITWLTGKSVDVAIVHAYGISCSSLNIGGYSVQEMINEAILIHELNYHSS